MAGQSILVIEDDEQLLELLRVTLEGEGYQMYTARDGVQGIDAFRSTRPDLVILDLLLPRTDGFEVCRAIRQEADASIVVLSARADEIDRVVCLEMGVDDYLIKPFSMRELVARIRARLRRVTRSSLTLEDHDLPDLLVSGNLELNLSGHTARLDGQRLSLKPREFQLLALLASRRGRVVSREFILQTLWEGSYFKDGHTLVVHIRWLREKIEEDPSNPQRIITVRGTGYRFVG